MNCADASIESILEDVREVDWQAWAIPQPDLRDDYRPETVIPAFEFLICASSSEETWSAYALVLDAMGHNHSGTPYSAIVPAAPLLARLVPRLRTSAAAAMEALTDATLWSADRPVFIGPDGMQYDQSAVTLAAAVTVVTLAHDWAEHPDDDRRRAASRLLEAVNDLSQ